jgi:hypothetical protein
MSNGGAAPGDGSPLSLDGVVYETGLGMHAGASVTYALRSTDRWFVAHVGVDDDCGPAGSVVFQVLVDGVPRYTSPKLTGSSETRSLAIGVAGARKLVLKVTNGGDGNACDHADWAGARLVA